MHSLGKVLRDTSAEGLLPPLGVFTGCPRAACVAGRLAICSRAGV